ncbi:kinase-like protein [Neolentinus lepideus HHB14362 ss-1]|uniref:Kinase-like protein n=1 Tax=Neolentinus lepideus HHB14362 ss-1 TaxID=1314782 RepID=A0A165WAD8_9AGAM|nr:kinase-like protein [Neolentinus lepideus HHB14362 ss-1]
MCFRHRAYPELLELHSTNDVHFVPYLLAFIDQDSTLSDIQSLSPASDFVSKLENLLDVILKEADDETKAEHDHEPKLDTFLLRVSQRAGYLPPCLFLRGVEDVRLETGSTCDIYKARLNETGDQVALKIPRMHVLSKEEQEEMRKMLYREAFQWRRLRHVNIYPFSGLYRDPNGRLSLVSPWSTSGHVLAFLKEHPGHDRVRIIQDIADGLYYLHSRGVVHGDLKAANILMSDDKRACITDFGISKFLQRFIATNQTTKIKGTTRYMPPELMYPKGKVSEARTTAGDVYSFGLVCLEVYTGSIPWPNDGDGAVMQDVHDGNRPERPDGVPDEIWNIIQSCWKDEPKDRMSAGEIVSALSDYKVKHDLQTLSSFIDEGSKWDMLRLSADRKLDATKRILSGIYPILNSLALADGDCAAAIREHHIHIQLTQLLSSLGREARLPGTTSALGSGTGRVYAGLTVDTSAMGAATSIINPSTASRTEWSSVATSPSSSSLKSLPATEYLKLFNQTASQQRADVRWESTQIGHDHACSWRVTCFVNDIERGSGEAPQKQQAKEEAARQAYYSLNWHNPPVNGDSVVVQSPVPDTRHSIPPPTASVSLPVTPMPARSFSMPISPINVTSPPVDRLYLPLFNQMASQFRVIPDYRAESTGPPHALSWKVRLLVNGEEKGHGASSTKKGAMEQAAREAYHNMGWNINS